MDPKQVSSGMQWVSKLFENVVVPTAVFSAIGYYLGWTASSAYYITLGLSPSFLKKSPQELWSYAWIEIVLAAVLLVVGIICFKTVRNILDSLKSTKPVLAAFYVTWVISIAGIVVFGLQTTVYRSFETLPRLRSIALLGLSVFGLFVAACIGKFISEKEIISKNARRLFGFFFPGFYICLVVVVLGLVFTLSRISAWRGFVAGQNDASATTGLPPVVLYSERPLPLRGTFDTGRNLHVYPDLYLVDVTDEYLFVLQREPGGNSAGFSTYTIPKRNDVILQVTR